LNFQMKQSQTTYQKQTTQETEVNQQEDSLQLLFIRPNNLQESFFYTYDNCFGEQTIGSILQAIKEEKKCHMKFTDVFGRKIQKDMTEEQFRALQPYYITKMVPNEKVQRQHVEEEMMIEAQIKSLPFEDTREVTCKPSDSIQKFKEKACKEFGIENEAEIYVVQWNLTILKDDLTLSQCGILPNKTSNVVTLVKPTCSGRCGFPFVDITNDSKAKLITWSERAPQWRVAAPGLCVEGKCQNRDCKAFKSGVIINKGMGVYDVINDDHKNKCPMCSSYVRIEKCAFNNCSYKYTGMKMQNNGQPTQKITCQQEIEVGNEYKEFNAEMTGKAVWTTLKILTKKSTNRTVLKGECSKGIACGLCQKDVKANMRKLKCSHLFHDECRQRFMNITSRCAFCHK